MICDMKYSVAADYNFRLHLSMFIL